MPSVCLCCRLEKKDNGGFDLKRNGVPPAALVYLQSGESDCIDSYSGIAINLLCLKSISDLRVEKKNCRLFTFNLFLTTCGQPFLFFFSYTQEEELMRSEKGCDRNVRTSLRGRVHAMWRRPSAESLGTFSTRRHFSRVWQRIPPSGILQWGALVYKVGKPWHVSILHMPKHSMAWRTQCWYVDKDDINRRPRSTLCRIVNGKSFFLFWDGPRSFPYRFLPFFSFFFFFECFYSSGFVIFILFGVSSVAFFFTKFRNKKKREEQSTCLSSNH